MSQPSNVPTVSVIMSVYNGAAFLPAAIDSILTQTYQDFEFLIIDDASTDESPKILEAYARQDPRIICYRNNENKGITKCLNNLLSKAKGQFVARMDGDDISHPSRLTQEIQVMSAGNIDLVWTNAVLIDELGREICQRYQPPLAQTVARLTDKSRWGNYIVHPSVMFNRETVQNLGGYDQTYRSGQDGNLWQRMKEAGCQFALISEPLLKYRITASGITTSRLGYNDINGVYAYMCLANRQPKAAWQYIKQVKNPLHKLALVTRWGIGENLIDFLKGFRIKQLG